MSDLLEAGLGALRAGLNPLPPRSDGSKAPAFDWKERMTQMATEEEVRSWYANGTFSGLGLVCGTVSGGLEMLEFEGRARDEGLSEAFLEAADAAGLGELVDRVIGGYLEETPSGGFHLLWRCEEIERNQKLARRPATEEELAVDPNDKVRVLIETRGQGGFVVVAPSAGATHPTGRPWRLVQGGFDSIVTITPAERAELLRLARSFDQTPKAEESRPAAPSRFNPDLDTVRPGDDFSQRTTWPEILEPHGWRHIFTAADGNQHWRRPGKTMGTSATISENGEGVLYVFSSSTVLESDRAYSKFGAYSVLNHGGDHRAAAKSLAERGYGTQDRRSPRLAHDDGDPGPTEPEANGYPEPVEDTYRPSLEVIGIADLVREVEAAPPTGWLVKSIWPADAYGVMAAEQKAGKTWADLDLAVSVASGTPWMGIYETAEPAPVLLFLGEGGRRKMKRRLDAVCESRDVDLSSLPLRLCFKVPQLTQQQHLGEMRAEIAAHRPSLVILDPLYLAARGAKGSQLYEMGEHLSNVQEVCQEVGAALCIVHHWNKTGEGKGAKRMTGVGPGEWGRVLISVSVISRVTVPETKETKVCLEWEFMGDEIPETELKIRRRVWADDPDDLDSPLHYVVEELEEERESWSGPTQCMAAVAAVLLEDPSIEWSKGQMAVHLRGVGKSYRTSTIHEALERLVAEDRATMRRGPRSSQLFKAGRADAVQGQEMAWNNF